MHRPSTIAPLPDAGRRQTKLVKKAYDLIRQRILRGEFPLGSAIPRRELAQELGMSLQPISEALQRLERDALVETTNRVGTRVRVPRPQEIRGLFVMNECLETQAARMFAVRASGAQRRELQRLAAAFDEEYDGCAEMEILPDDRLRGILELHMHLHRHIAVSAGCQMLSESIEKNHTLMGHYIWDSLRSIGHQLYERTLYPQRWHSTLATGLIGRDEEAADAAMRCHVRYGRQELIECLEPYCVLDPNAL